LNYIKKKEELQKRFWQIGDQLDILRSQIQQLMNLQQQLIGQEQLLDELIKEEEMASEKEKTQ